MHYFYFLNFLTFWSAFKILKNKVEQQAACDTKISPNSQQTSESHQSHRIIENNIFKSFSKSDNSRLTRHSIPNGR